MSKKSNNSDILDLLHRTSNMTPSEVQKTIDSLADMGIEPLDETLTRPGITCPFTDTQLVVPCSMEKCSFYIKNVWSKNCLLQYMDNQNADSLSVEEIAFLYETNTKTVENSIKNSMEHLKEGSEESLGISGDFVKKEKITFKINTSFKETEINSHALSPPFIENLNSRLIRIIPDEEVVKHPAARFLAALDVIISELE